MVQKRVNQKGIFKLLISERRLSSEKWLMLLIRNLNVKCKDQYGTWDDFVTSHFAMLPRVGEAGKPKPLLTPKRHRFNPKTVNIFFNH